MRREILFSGGFVIFKQIKPIKALCDYTDQFARAYFSQYDPQIAHHHLSNDVYQKAVHDVQRAFTRDSKAKQLFYAALAFIGVDLRATYCDWFPLRIQPGTQKHLTSNTTGLAAHRDSWYANLFCQTNWWLPIYSMLAQHAVIFYPKYWDVPVANNSKDWDLHAFRAARQRVREAGGDLEALTKAYRHITPTESLDETDGVRFILEPGDILSFSLAHLHASALNDSDLARFSTELRTIHRENWLSGRGAKNIDGLSTGDSTEDFFNMHDGSPLQVHVTC